MPFLRARWRLLAGTAVALYATAWLLPVALIRPVFPKNPTAQPDLLYAWQAVLVALAPALDPDRPASVAEAIAQVLSVASGLTNLLFVAVAAFLLLRRVAGMRTEVAVWVAVATNLVWLGTSAGELRVGYFFWAASFVVLALAVRGRRQTPPATTR